MTVHIERFGPARIQINAGPRMGDLVKQIPGARYRNAEADWTAPLSWGTCLAARGVFGAELEVGAALAEWACDRKQEINTVTFCKTYIPDIDERLYPFQRSGAAFLSAGKRVLLADEQGTGKSVQTVAALRHTPENVLPILVVAPNSMLYTWRDEFARWWPEVSVAVASGSAAKRRKAIQSGADVVVIGWASMRSHSRLAPYGSIRLTDKQKQPGDLNEIQWGTVVADEAHRAKDAKSQQTRALWAIMHHAPRRICLTGTPIADTPGDLYGPMHAIAPEEWPSYVAFIDRYTNNALLTWGEGQKSREVFGLNPRTRDEFYALLDPRFLRRTKAEVLPQLPAKVYSTRTVDMHTKQLAAYKQMSKHMLTALDSGLLLATDPLVKLARLSQIASAMPVLDAEGNVVALDKPSCKVDALLEILDEAPGEPLVVFAASRKLLELCAVELDKKKITHTLITGQVSAEERSFGVRAFQDGERQVVLATVGAGGEGITLTRASRLAFLQRPWSLVQASQAEDRVHRVGQEAVVEIIDVVTADSVEAAVLGTLRVKGERAQEVVRDPEWLRTVLAA